MPYDAQITVTTARQPGAVAIIQLHGPDAALIVRNIATNCENLPVGKIKLANLAAIDEGLVARLGFDVWQLMPHGGLRVIQRIVEALIEQGARLDEQPVDARAIYPEADSAFEADLLATLARAGSPLAIDLLAGQTHAWREVLTHDTRNDALKKEIAQRSTIWQRLIDPPTVVMVSRPNIGKSTLFNALSGKAGAIVADLPGTTRDWIGGLVELNAQVAVHWLDTPGIRDSNDPVEQQAITLARQAIAKAQVVVVMRDMDTDWPDVSALPKPPNVWVVNKIDQSPRPMIDDQQAILISAQTGQGLEGLQTAVIAALGLANCRPELPWAFSPTLQRWCKSEFDLWSYLD